MPPQHLWVGYGRTADEYLASGKAHVLQMCKVMQHNCACLPSGSRVLDFGCAAGRMTRHVPGWTLEDTSEIWGVDTSAPHIFWASRHLLAHLNFVLTTQYPHLPFEDGYFNLVFACSVFTHIDDLAESWFLELRRVVTPGGYIYATVNDETTVNIVSNQEWPDEILSKYRFPTSGVRAPYT